MTKTKDNGGVARINAPGGKNLQGSTRDAITPLCQLLGPKADVAPNSGNFDKSKVAAPS